jgi:hypothetical protein
MMKETERLEVAGEHLHGGNATGLKRLDELGPRGERKICAAPQTEPLGIGEIVDRGGASQNESLTQFLPVARGFVCFSRFIFRSS